MPGLAHVDTSLLDLANVKQCVADGLHGLAESEASAYTWVHDKFFGKPIDAVPDHPNETDMINIDPWDMKMVEYYGTSCPHCKSLAPIWDGAEAKWNQQVTKDDDLPAVSWEKRECYTDNFAPGKDFEECQQQNIDRLPTMKLFKVDPRTATYGSESMTYRGKRNVAGLVDFVRRESEWVPPGGYFVNFFKSATGMDQAALPSPETEEIPDNMMNIEPYDLKAVHYPSDDTNVGRDLQETTFTDAADKWYTAAHEDPKLPAVSWETRDCEGKDHEECLANQPDAETIQPVIKIYKVDPFTGAYVGDGVKYDLNVSGGNKPEDLLNFVKKEAGSVPEGGYFAEYLRKGVPIQTLAEAGLVPTKNTADKVDRAMMFPMLACLPTAKSTKCQRQARAPTRSDLFL